METVKTYEIVDSVESLEKALGRVREAQKKFATYTQSQVDEIFKVAAMAANQARIHLAKMAVEETGMGIVEDKVIKNHYAAEYIYNAYRDTKTCGVIEEDKAFGVTKIAEPIGVVGAVIPTTNPTSTAIFKTLISLKTRNGIIISPHPRAKNSTIAAAKVVLETVADWEFLDRVNHVGDYIRGAISSWNLSIVKGVRGRGLMIGTQIDSSVKPFDIEVKCLEKGLCTTVAGADVVRFLPPLTISDKEVEQGLLIYKEVLESFCK